MRRKSVGNLPKSGNKRDSKAMEAMEDIHGNDDDMVGVLGPDQQPMLPDDISIQL